jgi:hypothetical protein
MNPPILQAFRCFNDVDVEAVSFLIAELAPFLIANVFVFLQISQPQNLFLFLSYSFPRLQTESVSILQTPGCSKYTLHLYITRSGVGLILARTIGSIFSTQKSRGRIRVIHFDI